MRDEERRLGLVGSDCVRVGKGKSGKQAFSRGSKWAEEQRVRELGSGRWDWEVGKGRNWRDWFGLES